MTHATLLYAVLAVFGVLAAVCCGVGLGLVGRGLWRLR